jgi:NAD(P)-dependent dehydrogenase (short-subunit alcohol dehydrogenase family)
VVHACDATDPGAVEALFPRLEPALGGAPDVVVYNASGRLRVAPSVDLDPEAVARALAGLGLWRLSRGPGRRPADAAASPRAAILFTGASAEREGGSPAPPPSPMGKFALRGLAQSLARELQPRASTSLTS